MFTILLSHFPDTVKKDLLEICMDCGQICILEKDCWEEIREAMDAHTVNCFFFWLDENPFLFNGIISRIRQTETYRHTPLVFFSSKIEYLLSMLVQWKSCEVFSFPLRQEKKRELAGLIRYYEGLYRKIHLDTVLHCKISTSKECFNVPYADILFVESAMKKTVFHLKEGSISLPLPLYRVRELLPPGLFVQAHRSFIVNIKNISHIDKSGEPWIITFFGSKNLAYVSRNYKKDFLRIFPFPDCRAN